MQRSADGWLVTFRPQPAARFRLFCFPYAGGGASLFNSWCENLVPDVELTAVQLPGREERIRDPLARRIHDVTAQLAPVLKPRLDRTYALLGYSLGALLAYDLAIRLSADGTSIRPPSHLFVLARPAPHRKDSRPSFYEWPQEAFLAELQRRYGALPAVLLQSPEIMKIYLPIVRADLEMVDTYEPPEVGALRCPVSAIAGTRDLWTADEVIAWNSVTTGPFQYRTLPGDHFFLRDSREELCRIICESLVVPKPLHR